MKGYIVGYFETWANDRNPIIIGYYTTWNRALGITKQLERENLDYHKGLQSVYLVEIEVNKTYPVTNPILDWIDNYTNYKVKTTNGKTTLRNNKGREIVVELPERIPLEDAEPLVRVISAPAPETPPKDSKPEWTTVVSRKTRQRTDQRSAPKRGNRLSRRSGASDQN
jgi:hypothetical protein